MSGCFSEDKMKQYLKYWDDRGYIIIESAVSRQQVRETISDKNNFHDSDIAKIKQNYCDVMVISNCGNYGKGYSIRRGVDLANGKYICYTNIDFPIKESDFFNAYNQIKYNNIDLVIGERFLNNKSKANFYRKITSKIFLK
ncbi:MULTISPECIES: glycosyltransferase [Xenorhabdus]|uniref:glycosyltransferase n=1 Tax=Xenorhabdus TaxID=626 RepID=UPI0006468A20|nr:MULTISPECIES: glycosyltransferase [Xenorhabdus]MBC8944290.1 family 2 glycosyl transferase [Xenorhabdus indica]